MDKRPKWRRITDTGGRLRDIKLAAWRLQQTASRMLFGAT
jgi:hypothetical protein